jgi:hypothetical protein
MALTTHQHYKLLAVAPIEKEIDGNKMLRRSSRIGYNDRPRSEKGRWTYRRRTDVTIGYHVLIRSVGLQTSCLIISDIVLSFSKAIWF